MDEVSISGEVKFSISLTDEESGTGTNTKVEVFKDRPETVRRNVIGAVSKMLTQMGYEDGEGQEG